jgi:hypothetical protein
VAEIGQIPETPPGGTDGVWLGSIGGIAAKLAIGQRGSGGRALHLAIPPRSQEVQAGGTRYRISTRRSGGKAPAAGDKSRRNPVQFSRLEILANGTSREVKPCRQAGKRNLTNTRANV